MRVLLRLLVAISCVLALARPVWADEPQRLHIFIDVTYAPEVGDKALQSSALLAEWYPKINTILYGADHPLPYNLVLVMFQPDMKYPAVTTGNTIHVNVDYLKVMHDDYRAMIIHELTHVAQHYPPKQAGGGWVVEGIADYIRHKYFEKDQRETLRLDSNATPTGYSDREPYLQSLERDHASLRDKGYLKTYTVASAFLLWLENHKDKNVVRELNLALSKGEYSPDIFKQTCGATLDDLWAEFVTASEHG